MPLFLSQLINAVFPPVCPHCSREGSWLCPASKLELHQEPVWPDPLAIPGIDRVLVRGSYDCRPLQAIITKLKYGYWSGLQEVLPDTVGPLARRTRRWPPSSVIIPVPLHPRRFRERGFNQSRFVAEALSGQTGYPVTPLLTRIRYTTPQASLHEAARKTNMIDAFSIVRGVAKVPLSGILVDDVITTGSTIAECASVLRQSGMKHVTAVALAKG